MLIIHRWTWTAAVLALHGLVLAAPVRAATFPFGGREHGFVNEPSAQRVEGGFTLTLEPGPAGALLNGVDQRGSGVNSGGIDGVNDPGSAKFDVLGGTAEGAGESVDFWFDRPGRLTGINFDGVKDESLEYFILDTPHSGRFIFFDSQVNVNVPGAVEVAVQANAVTGAVVLLSEINRTIDDEAFGLDIPFAAGEKFTLTYAALGPTFGPIDTPNGARLQGITVVPEPATGWLLTGTALAAITSRSWRRRQAGHQKSNPLRRSQSALNRFTSCDVTRISISFS